MRVRLVAAAAAGTLAVALLGTLPATAASTTTLTGPARVGIEGTVTLSGHTAKAKAPVTIYFHRAGSSGYTARRQLTSNSAGTFSTTYVADADYRYYAVSGATRSAPGLTSLVRPSCTTSGPVFSVKGLSAQLGTVFPDALPSFQATNSAGIWAGHIDNQNRFSVISWSAATRKVTVLDSIDLSSVGVSESDDGPVQVVAVTKHGSVLAAVETLAHRSRNTTNFVGYVYSDGHRYQLNAAPNWTSVQPVGITNSGVIYGQIAIGSSRGAIVTWANATAPYHVLERTGAIPVRVVVDGNGDYSYLASTYSPLTVRRASGALVATLSEAENHLTVADGGASFYGDNYLLGSVQRWTVTRTGLKRVSLTPNTSGTATEASFRGAVLAGYGNSAHLRTAEGGYVALPAGPGQPYGSETGTAISSSNTVAFTSRHDSLVHFFSCR